MGEKKEKGKLLVMKNIRSLVQIWGWSSFTRISLEKEASKIDFYFFFSNFFPEQLTWHVLHTFDGLILMMTTIEDVGGIREISSLKFLSCDRKEFRLFRDKKCCR